MRAVVSAFDAQVGLGRLRIDDGTEVLFHCAEIADGSRSIEVGAAVTCEIREKFGRPEAFAVAAA